MLWKHFLLAAGAIGVANAQAGGAGGADSNGQQMSSSQMGAPSSTLSGAQPSGTKKGKTPVPSDLSSGFKPEQIKLKLKFKDGKGKKNKKEGGSSSTGGQIPQATNGGGKEGGKGKGKGKKLTMKDVMKPPKFWAKAEQIDEQSKFVIVMVDTTSEQNRILHYVRSDYQMKPKNSTKGPGQGQPGQEGKQGGKGGKDGKKGKKWKLKSETPPQMEWKAPGSLGDTGGKRQYTFLMYAQPQTFEAKNMPQPGQNIDMKQFVEQNGLQPAIAGKTINVDTSSNDTSSGSGAGGAPKESGSAGNAANGKSGGGGDNAANKVAQGAASSLRSQAFGAGVLSSVFAFGMALL